MQPAHRAVLVAQAGDIAGVGGVDEHLADRVLAEGAAAGGARAAGVEPLGDRPVGLLPGRVALVHLADQRRALGIGRGDPVLAADVAPGQLADEVALAGLLPKPGARPERQRHRVVLVEHLVDGLGQERRRVGRVVAHRLGDRDHADVERLSQELLVAAGLGLVPGEARRVVDEDDIEGPLGSVGHQPLKLRPRLGLAPARVEVGVLLDDRQAILGGEGPDCLALGVG
nr:hypothetical protein [Patulibacter medicamentivorans]